MKVAGCPLCDATGGHVVFDAPRFRVIRVEEEGFPAFWRVVWNEHVAEFSDLSPDDRVLCMEAVATVERVARAELSPAKMNVASLGNMVPHLHWHVIARFAWDSRFPSPVWAQPQREPDSALVAALQARLSRVDEALRKAFA